MHRLTETFALGLFFLLSFLSAIQLAIFATVDSSLLLLGIPTVLLALALADLLSGVTHFLLDSKGQPDTPFWGTFIRPFHEHHDDPEEMTRHDIVHTNGHTAIAICPFMIAVMLGHGKPLDALATLQFIFLYSLLVFLGFTNQFHKWAHAVKTPHVVRWLQKMRLILPAEHHALHHATHRDHFCITTGWNNAWLARTQLLQKLFRERDRNVATTSSDAG